MSSQVTLACPRCGQVDNVRKVTSIVAEGTSHFHITQGSTPVRLGGQTSWLPSHGGGSSVTELAKRLLMPLEEPKGFVHTTLKSLGLALFLILGSPIAAYVLFQFSEPLGVCFGLLALFFVVPFSVLVLKEVVSGREKRRSEAAQQQYQRALAKWNELYYCYRDDIVFVPGQSGYASPEQMREFLTQ